MALIVQKYGGTSLANIDCIELVAEKVSKAYSLGHDVVVVVSAMAGETDRLESLARRISINPSARELDVLLSTGEQVTIALLALALQKRGVLAKSYTAKQLPIIAKGVHLRANIDDINVTPILENMRSKVVTVIAGFQGVDEQNEVFTLGRGGSDTTAVAIASALGASECQIYTDVDGVYTTDPRVVSNAKKINALTFKEILELSKEGAKVLQVKAVEFAMQYNIPVRVLSTFCDTEGTLITPYVNTKVKMVSGIAFKKKQALISITGLESAKELKEYIELNVQYEIDVLNIEHGKCNLLVAKDNVLQLTDKLLDFDVKMSIKSNSDVCKISLVGGKMQIDANMIDEIKLKLREQQIDFIMCQQEGIKVYVILDDKDLERCVNLFHGFYCLGCKENLQFTIN